MNCVMMSEYIGSLRANEYDIAKKEDIYRIYAYTHTHISVLEHISAPRHNNAAEVP